MVYINLIPVRAGLVHDAAKYVFSGHRELVGKVESSPMISQPLGHGTRSHLPAHRSITGTATKAYMQTEYWPS